MLGFGLARPAHAARSRVPEIVDREFLVLVLCYTNALMRARDAPPGAPGLVAQPGHYNLGCEDRRGGARARSLLGEGEVREEWWWGGIVTERGVGARVEAG